MKIENLAVFAVYYLLINSNVAICKTNETFAWQ